MLKDIVFNGNKVSGNETYVEDDDNTFQGGGFSSRSSSSSNRSNSFDPSDAAGEAFRSVFGDDN